MTSTMRFDKWENSLGQPYGTVLQVVSVTKTDAFSTSSTSFTDVTGLSATITPKSATSKIFITASIMASSNENVALLLRLLRGSTDISVGDAAGSRARVTSGHYPGAAAGISGYSPVSVVFLDSPGTTSATNYKIQIAGSSANLVAINRGTLDNDASNFQRSTSTITLMEIAQ